MSVEPVPDEFRDVPGFDEIQVNATGLVLRVMRSTGRRIVVTPTSVSGERPRPVRVRLWRPFERYSVPVAELVLRAWIGPPPDVYARPRFINGDIADHSARNLAWT